MSEQLDHFSLHAIQGCNNREDIEENMCGFIEDYFSDQVEDLIRHTLQLDFGNSFANRGSSKSKKGVIVSKLNKLGLGKYEEDEYSNGILEYMRLDGLGLDLNTVLSEIFLEISSKSPDDSILLDASDSLNGVRSITFKTFGESFDREELLSNESFKTWLERKCKTAIFEVRYAFMTAKSRQKIDGIA